MKKPTISHDQGQLLSVQVYLNGTFLSLWSAPFFLPVVRASLNWPHHCIAVGTPTVQTTVLHDAVPPNVPCSMHGWFWSEIFDWTLCTFQWMHVQRTFYIDGLFFKTGSLGTGLVQQQAQGHFTVSPLPFEMTSGYLSFQQPQLQPSGNISKQIFLTSPLLLRHQNTWWPIDVMKLLHLFWCWTLIWLSCHWVELLLGYWRHKNMIDQLIYWLHPQGIHLDEPM